MEGDSPKARATPAPKRKSKIALPTDFGISDRVKAWAAKKGYGNLEGHFEAFVSKAKAKGYNYVDWDEAFMGAVRDDWAGMRRSGSAFEPGAMLDKDTNPPWLAGTGFPDVFAAENAGCGPGNASKYRNRERAEA